MNSTEAMFLLLKESLFSEEQTLSCSVSDWDWPSIYKELCVHSIESLPYRFLKKNIISDEKLRADWNRRCLLQLRHWAQVMHGQQKLLQLLDENHIDCVILKGSAAALSYPQPILRVMGDVDFLVRKVDYEKTADLLEKNGYQLAHEKNAKDHHYEYFKDGISYELHKRLAIIRESDDELNALFDSGITNREIRQVGNYSFPVLPVDLNGLVLLFHINQHLRSGLGLRQIIDWMMYVDKNGIEGLLPLLKKTEMEKFAFAVTAMCQKFLGLKTIVSMEEDYPCDELMEYVLAKGNFGRKSGEKGKIASVFLDMNNPIRAFKRLQIGGQLRWKAAKKYKFLRPVAWIYQITFIIKELKQNKITMSQFWKQREEGLEQRELVEKLGLQVERMIDIEE